MSGSASSFSLFLSPNSTSLTWYRHSNSFTVGQDGCSVNSETASVNLTIVKLLEEEAGMLRMQVQFIRNYDIELHIMFIW